ncbi:4F2 cell-surface antigen heavy chain-like [Synchiropus splendidus]|uniref:4F2 cell-surface antigen heavy chain-like n=1 Tax=Synchiropus splendidus TaxID=270530 RepID=UPI00237EA82C|nr:4F2 cell-surface antigen heavy chain-like [Synchiropus splendidus]
MSAEETNVELQEPADAGAPQRDGVEPRQVAADADATEADVSEADLDQEEQEKQPMTGGESRTEDAAPVAAGVEMEKNGAVKLKMPEEMEEVKFTGLSKEELLKVAGTPCWVRTRWALLVVFWLGWLGMLVGAVLIILQAPRCKDLPATSWWNEGPLYQIGDVRAFSEKGNLKGVQERIQQLSQLKVKGLVLGPIHVAPPDDVMGLSFEDVSDSAGNLEQFKSLIQAAHKKGISVVLDLTPNYQGSSGPWFSNDSVTNVAERLKSALVFWLNEGVDGVQLSGVEHVSTAVPLLWTDIRAILQNRTDKRVLIGVTDRSWAEQVSDLLTSSGVDLLLSAVLQPIRDATQAAQSITSLSSSQNQSQLAWSLGGPRDGHLVSLVSSSLVRLYQLMLFTLPGTPVFKYGDEIGLVDQGTKFPRMLWDSDSELNGTLQGEREERLSLRSFFRDLSELRGKERSLLFGNFALLFNSTTALAYVRVWDQNTRYVAAFNWDDDAVVLQLQGPLLPPQASVVVATNATLLPAESPVDLGSLQLGPGQAALLKFPYSG